jgi:glycosyltransferase involved in cell wall biosynthesis
MKSVTIGIYLDEDVKRLDATLAGLRAHTELPCELVLLPDGVPPAAKTALAGRGIPLLESSASGAPAWFNRLAAYNQSDVIVFLEGGAVPGPRWLQMVLTALAADSANALAGPSTNASWNEQCVHRGGSSLAEVVASAQATARWFGSSWKTLEPLYSLSDFCYVVERRVIAAIGGADEEYGLGPCWEMDYNIRAARAGFRGVWACGAYVYRPPFSARRAREEPRRMEASKRRYQDKFCALRLTGKATAYEAHCKGDTCEHFAPRDLIRLPAAAAGLPAPVCVSPSVSVATPLISCVMATANRREFVLQSIRYFDRQDYTNRELVIADDGTVDLSRDLAANPRIRYLRVPRGTTIGDKRNRACEAARGAVIAQWDDDDWYAPGRLSAQAAPILSGDADITGCDGSVFFDLPRWRFWTCSPELHGRLFAENVHGGTLMFRREVWLKTRYPNASLAEDAALLRGAVYRGARLRRVPGGGLFLYLRHAGNTWAFECGRHLDPRGWTEIPQPDLGEDLDFYAARSSAPAAHAAQGAQPLVSCIMPTANRRAFLPQAIRCFERQTYLNRELIILDDGCDPVQDLVPDDARIRYMRREAKCSLGAKRNKACELARGQIIAHWDDDDWMADWRLAYQVDALARTSQPSACGLSRLYFCHRRGDTAWMYVHPANQRPWIAGATMCYHKSLWQEYRFQEINEGEDTRFVWAIPASSVLPLPDNRFYVASVHAANASPKRTSDPRWQVRPPSEVRELIGESWETFFGQATG